MKSIQINLRREKSGGFFLTNLELLVPDLPAEFHDYRIIQLSDFHFGAPTPISHIKKAFAIAERNNPDLVLLTGDFLQLEPIGITALKTWLFGPRVGNWFSYKRDVRAHAQELAREMAILKPEDGIYGVLGNHDHFEGAQLIKRQFESTCTVLENTHSEITRGSSTLFLAGVDDYKRGKPDISQSLNGYGPLGSHLKPGLHPAPFLKILLSHNPDIVLAADAHLLDEIDLLLCGHTHGGQVCLPFLPPPVTRTRQSRHVRGLTWRNDTAIYITNGVGYGNIRFRFFCPPEVTLITLKELSPTAVSG